MRLLVCGGRDFDDYRFLCEVLDNLKLSPGSVVINGAAKGADSLSSVWARRSGFGVEEYPAEWNKYGKSAGPIRNQHMLNVAAPDAVVAFPGGNGTADMIRRAKDAGLPIMVF